MTMKVRWIGQPPPSAPQKPETEIDYTEGLWHEMPGNVSWTISEGNPACLVYAMRMGLSGLPVDNKVHYVHIGNLGHLVHESELIEEEAT